MRHPFVRLVNYLKKTLFIFTISLMILIIQVSAYQDKVLDTNYLFWHKLIPKDFQKEPKETRPDPERPTFAEFVRSVVAISPYL